MQKLERLETNKNWCHLIFSAFFQNSTFYVYCYVYDGTYVSDEHQILTIWSIHVFDVDSKFGVLLNWKRPKLELSYRFKVWMAKLFAIGKFPINWIAFKLFYGAVVWTRVFKYGYMSHFMSEKKHYQENADSVEEMLSNFANSNGSTGEINKYLKCLVHEGYI